MSDTVKFTIDGVEVEAKKGETILQAADRAGIYIPRLCAHPELVPFGSCRVCTVLVNGRPQSSCTQPAAEGIIVENDTPKLKKIRRDIIEMLFVEGNHFCPYCEKSGNCELQAIAYRLGMDAPHFPYMFPKREMDCSHDDLYLDHNRCILCGRCVRAARDLDGKTELDFENRGIRRKITVQVGEKLAASTLKRNDHAAEICPVGALVKKEVGYATPVGQRKYDKEPIGSEIEKKRQTVEG
ncbi:MAG: NADP oxidoreductase [Lentisphaerae bacterium]|nr:MAG: NADP oxidoreductase [Lentisphaerota bacterium]